MEPRETYRKITGKVQETPFFSLLFLFLEKRNPLGKRAGQRWESEKCPKQLRKGRMEIVYVYQKLRKDFGRAPKFTDLHADIVFEIMPNPEMMG